MEPFLSQVARVYVENESQNLIDYCFVFPNKRSGVFFADYLSKMLSSNTVMPHIITISDFVSEFSSGIDASRLELMFILYDEYRNLLRERSLDEQIVDFDKFQFWAEMVLNDFNDVDKYLIDAKQLFININRLKEINSNFLSEEQIEVINRYWGEKRVNDSVDSFWKHITHESTTDDLKTHFVKLWQILYDLYVSFKTRLSSMGLCYSGMSYREVAENNRFNNPNELNAKRYIFVGFNVLSTSEIKILERLNDINCADFYWDFNSPAYEHSANHATRFVGKYVKWFKSRYSLFEGKITEFPSIEVIGVPSNVGQVKETANIIGNLQKNKLIDNVNTAIVLPDEGLFIPLLHSLPTDYSTSPNNKLKINITMGYPMRHTPIAALISNVVSMQLRARKVHDKMQFYYEDIFNVLSHPLVKSAAADDCRALAKYINDNRAFNLPAEFLAEKFQTLSPIFQAVYNLKDTHEVIGYTCNLVSWAKSHLPAQNNVEIGFADKYLDALYELEQLIDRYHIVMNDKSIFHLLERAVGSETINFKGEPLKGLQIMGVLETRALDFENIIILSMNERVFPRKHYAKTFIPNALRHGYGMSTISFQESMYAYYFYRMISRAKNVYIMYDARTGRMRSGEMSRYLYQLKFLYDRTKIKFSMVSYNVIAPQTPPIEVVKTSEVMRKLNLFKTPDSNRNLSASALKKYISCPLSFYLYYVEGLQQEDEITEYMDEGTYGTIMHEIFEKIYTSLRGNAQEVKVTDDIIDAIKKRQGDLMKQITRSINHHYNKLGKDNDTPLTGDGKVLGEIMLHFTLLMLDKEKKFTDFHFIDAEAKHNSQWIINNRHTINFKQIIDRIDRIMIDNDPRLRIVDYKTGSDETKLSSIDQLFDKNCTKNVKAIFQLFVYCFYYSYYTGYKGDIQPIIYNYRTLSTSELSPIIINNEELETYLTYKDEFWKHFEQLIDEIFDPEIPFRPTTNDVACQYCKLMQFCGKEPKQQ